MRIVVVGVVVVQLAACNLFLGESSGTGDGDAGDGDGDGDDVNDGGGKDDASSGGLITSGVVVRYFLDNPLEGPITDAVNPPFNLGVLQDTSNSIGVCATVELQTGFCWDRIEAEARLQASIDNSKVQTALSGNTQITVELVATIEAASTDASRLLQIGPADSVTQSGLTIMTVAPDQLSVQLGDAARVANASALPSGRFVLHVVIDTEQAVPNDRIRFFADGSEIAVQATDCGAGPDCAFPVEGASVTLTTEALTLGNRGPGDRSFQGTLHYAALYERALSDLEVVAQAQRLGGRDDR